MSDVAPLPLHSEPVRPEWIDLNGHMNVAYYGLVFEHALDAFAERIGMGVDYVKRTGRSIFALDTRTIYVREMLLNDPLQSAFQLIDFDAKRMHYLLHLKHGREGWMSAIFEAVSLHVDLAERRAAPFPEAIRKQLAQFKEAHAALPRPARLERPIGLASPIGLTRLAGA